jgi:predicted phosphodiesterase
MRIAVLSDIHANFQALRAVLDDAIKQNVNCFLCLGDIVGYGADALECFHLLQTRVKPCGWIAGNHDWELTGQLPSLYSQGVAQWSLKRTRELAEAVPAKQQALTELITFLQTLPTYAEGPDDLLGVWLMHGRIIEKNSDTEPDMIAGITDRGYVFPSLAVNGPKAERSYQWARRHPHDPNILPRVLLAGHTHMPMLWERQLGNALEESDWKQLLPPQTSVSETLEWNDCPRCHGDSASCGARGIWNQPLEFGHNPVWINPGSIGQPRDGCPAASYAVLDLAAHRHRVTFRRIMYPVEDAVKSLALFRNTNKNLSEDDRIRENGYIQTLKMLLERGGNNA